ncbi:uncharacterized protein LOC127802893 isoform X2 [Diospyros lotus]|uniref:uncharacterized protein LOC127802893 isoform X2 n=1 Tax=Diospyros lotus TaxID=55363 RepID=UPI002254BC94|nr:uncharacterized protein LOC127802893 isoform X2 [Diospyros lotus]
MAAVAYQHFSHEHPLSFEASLGATCSGCKFSIDYGSAFICSKCDFCLHDLCFRAPRSFTHRIHANHPLNLIAYPTYHTKFFNCDVCKEDGYGFSYSCGIGKIDVHVHCALAGGFSEDYKPSYEVVNDPPLINPNPSPTHSGDGKHSQSQVDQTTDYKSDTASSDAHEFAAAKPRIPQENDPKAAPKNTDPLLPQPDQPITDHPQFPPVPNIPAIDDDKSDVNSDQKQQDDSPPNQTDGALSSQIDHEYQLEPKTEALGSLAIAPEPKSSSQDAESWVKSTPNPTTKVTQVSENQAILSQDLKKQYFSHHVMHSYNVPEEEEDRVRCSACNKSLSVSGYRCNFHVHESCLDKAKQQGSIEEEEESLAIETITHESVATKVITGKVVREITIRRISSESDQSNPNHQQTLRHRKVLKGEASGEHSVDASDDSVDPEITKMVQLGSAATETIAHESVATKTEPGKSRTRRMVRRIIPGKK